MKLEAWAVGITAGSREVLGRNGLWQENPYNNNNNNNNNNNKLSDCSCDDDDDDDGDSINVAI